MSSSTCSFGICMPYASPVRARVNPVGQRTCAGAVREATAAVSRR
jgi:hypothetical protein